MNSLQMVWNCSSLSISTKVHLYQALIRSVLLYGTETLYLLVTDMNTLEAFNMRCQRQILDVCWWVHVSNASVLQRSGLSTIDDILRYRRLSLFGHVARLDPGVPAHDALRLMGDTYATKAERQWSVGEDRRIALATSGSKMFRRIPTLYCYLCCGDLRSPGVTERRDGPLGLRDDDDDDDDEG